MSSSYEIIALDSFTEGLEGSFKAKDQDKIRSKTQQMLANNPYRYSMLQGVQTISGVKLAGLRRMKVGIGGGKRGGAVVLYRICDECKKNAYYAKSDVQCEFCDDDKGEHVVLFNTFPRSFGYK